MPETGTLKKVLNTAALIGLPFEPSEWRKEARKLHRMAFWVGFLRDTLLMMTFIAGGAYLLWLSLAVGYSWTWGIPIDLGHLLAHPFSDPVADYTKGFNEAPSFQDSLSDGYVYAP